MNTPNKAAAQTEAAIIATVLVSPGGYITAQGRVVDSFERQVGGKSVLYAEVRTGHNETRTGRLI